MMIQALFAGAAGGLGIALLISELKPAPPHLATALARLEGKPVSSPAERMSGPFRFAIPHSDLELTETDVDALVFKRIGFLALGMSFPSFLVLLAIAAGLNPSWAVPVFAGLITGPLFAVTPDIAVRRQAREMRVEFRAALSTYLDLVALERAGGAGSSEALHSPADVCHGWVFQRIKGVLDESRRAGRQPWQGLADLGRNIDLSELTDLADISEDAGAVGAQVMPTLMAKAQSMRTAALTDARAEANSRTSEMPIAIALSLSGFLLLICFPAMYHLYPS